MKLRVVHHTTYAYAAPALMSLHQAHLRPAHDAHQRCLLHALTVDPKPSQQRELTDPLSNVRTEFAIHAPHERLDVRADSLVETFGGLDFEPLNSPEWESVAAQFVFSKSANFQEISLFALQSSYVEVHATFHEVALQSFTPNRPWLDACKALMDQLHTMLRFDPGSTTVNTPAREALERGHGVCQDFAHIMLACLRSLGLPARYESGYLLTQPPEGQPRLLGADASHAWISVPHNGQWHHFDPTNARCGLHAPGQDYVRVASGRDFGDVSPLRGVVHGGGSHQLHVGVTVAPPEEFPTF